MSVIVNVVVEDYDVQNLMRDLGLAISGPSFRRFLKDDVSDFFRNDIQERFNEEGDLASGFWAPLSPATLHIKQALPDLRGGPEDINVRTGDMFDFLTDDYPVASGSDWAELEIPGDPPSPMLEKKLHTAQRGSSNNPMPGFGPTPPRPVLALSEAHHLAVILEMLEFHIIDTLVGSIV